MKLDGLANDTIWGGMGITGGYAIDPWMGRIMALTNLVYIAYRIYKTYQDGKNNVK